MFDQKDLELLLKKLEGYRDSSWEKYEYYKDCGPEWKEFSVRNYGEVIGYEVSMIMVRKMLRGDDL